MTRSRGFTLLEILVVMALLSVVMLALGSALRTVAQTEQRIDQRLARADDFRVAASFMRSTLGRVSARKVAGTVPQGASTLFFAASPDTVAWVGVMPPRFGAGGRYFFRLGPEQLQSGTALVVRFLPWTDAPGFPDWNRAESRVLVQELTAFSIRYEDARPVPALWLPGWQVVDRLPDRISMSIQTASATWPEIAVALRVLPGSTNVGGFVIGGNSE